MKPFSSPIKQNDSYRDLPSLSRSRQPRVMPPKDSKSSEWPTPRSPRRFLSLGLPKRREYSSATVWMSSWSISPAGSRAVQTLVGGSIDVAAIGGPAGVDARLAGADTIYVAIPVNRVIVFTVAGPQIQRIEELRGKSIGVTRVGTVTDFFTRVYLRQNGLMPDRDVMIRQMGGLPEIVAGLKAGQIQGGTFGFPAVLHARAAGFHVLVDYNTLGYRYPLSSVIVTQKMLPRTRESAIRGFLEAHIEAVHRFKTDPNFAMNVIGKYTSTADRAMLDETQRVYAAAFERIPYPNVEDMKLGISASRRDQSARQGCRSEGLCRRRLVARDRGEWIREKALRRAGEVKIPISSSAN